MKISIFLLFFSFPLFGQQSTKLDSILSFYSVSTELSQASWGLYASYADDTIPLIDHHPSLRLAPASNLKVVTSAAALTYYGPDFRFETRVGHSGRIVGQELCGDLIITGSGDPTFCSSKIEGNPDLDSVMRRISSELKMRGLKKIRGNFIINLSAFDDYKIPDYWPWIDIGNYYGAGVSALCVNENLYYLFFKPGEKVGEPAQIIRTEPALSGVEFVNRVTTGPSGSGDNAYIYFSPLENKLIAEGTIPAEVDEFSIKGNLANPGKFFGEYLKKFLSEDGIMVEESAQVKLVSEKDTTSSPLFVFYSPRLGEIVKVINKRSNNLYTEQMLALLTLKSGKERSYTEGLAELHNFLKSYNLSPDGVRLYDGCGLSRNNCITPKSIVSVLRFMSKSPVFESYFESFPVAGDENDMGGFKRFGKGTILEKRLFVKSGLINGVRAFSGYLFNIQNRLIAFSFIANNHEGSAGRIDEIHKEILIKMAESY